MSNEGEPTVNILNRLPGPSRKPLATLAAGVLVWATGFVAGRIPLRPRGGTASAAYQWDRLCQMAHAASGGGAADFAYYQQVHAVDTLAGILIIVGLVVAAVGTVQVVNASRRMSTSPETAPVASTAECEAEIRAKLEDYASYLNAQP